MTMHIITLQQGSDAWHAHRAMHFNASDSPAMLGCSPFKSRAELLRERATGMAYEVDAATQRRFDAGHRFESLARPLAEEIIGESLYPVTGTNGQLSASFDGLTMCHDVAFEHKTLSASLRQAFDAIEAEAGDGSLLPKHYRAQMEQQLAVSGAERVLFMASRWDDNDNLIESAHCWYEPDQALRAEIVAGWEQFAADLATYEPETPRHAVVAAPVEGFGVLSLRVEGRVLASNLDAFKADAEAFMARLPKPSELQTDQDFVDADEAVKACAEAESRIKAAVDAALAQMSDVDAVLRAAGTVGEAIRAARLALDKAVKSEKESRKVDIVRAGRDAVQAHCVAINATLGEHAIGVPAGLSADLAAAIKGKRTLSSMRDAVDTAAAAAKIAASQQAERIRACIAVLAEHAEHGTLFPDRVTLCATKAPDDLRNLVAARVADHQKREDARLEAEREKIRQEEAAKARHEAEREARAEAQRQYEAGKAASTATVRLGEIVAAIAPLSITADGLASLGFDPVGHEKAAKLYRASDVPAICRALAQRLVAVAEKNQDRKAA